MITQEIILNMIPDSEPVIVRVNQYDTGTGRIVAHLFKGSVAYTPASGATAIIQGTKPDKHGFQYNATISGNTVTANLEQQMTACKGDVRTQFVVTETSGKTGTFVFILKVQESALQDDTDISETVLPDIIDAAESHAERAEQAADDAESWASHAPYIHPETYHWWVYDTTQHAFVDTGVSADGMDTSYNSLTHKPKINSVELSGNKSLADLGIVNNVQSDWNVTSSSSGAFIKNKPDLTLKADKTEAYLISETTEASLADSDKFPFYDASTTSKKHSTWSNIKAKLKAYFDSLYAAISSVYTKTETDGMINTAQDGIKANTQLIADTVGWSGKNLYDLVATSKTDQYGGVWTVNNDGTITVSGTPTAYAPFTTRSYDVLPVGNYIFTFNEANLVNAGLDTAIIYKNGRRVREFPTQGSNKSFTFSINANDDYDEIRIAFKRLTNNVAMSGIIKPMIRKADILDDTYEPYRGTTAFPRDEQAVLGAKNRLNFDAWKGIATSNATATWGDNSLTLVATGTNGRTNLSLSTSARIQVNAGEKYKFTWEDGGSENSAVFEIFDSRDTVSPLSTTLCTNEKTTVTVPSGCTELIYRVIIPTSGQTAIISNIMCTFATDPDDTYVPYAMTNKELTLALDGKLDKINGVFAEPSTPTTGDIYNSEEQVVGTWGKQGYEKTLYMSALMSEGNIPFNTENSEIVVTESHNIANIDEIVFAQFTCKPSSANVWSPLPHKKKYVEITKTDITGYTSDSSNEQAAIKGLVYYTKTS